MTTAAKPTPGPWVEFAQRNSDGAVELIVIMPAGRPGDIASVAVDTPTDEANAALIVQAVNCHACLVEALKLFESYGCPACSGDCASANPPVVRCPMTDARAALKATR